MRRLLAAALAKQHGEEGLTFSPMADPAKKRTGRQSEGDQERGPSFMATTPSMVAAYRLSSASIIFTWRRRKQILMPSATNISNVLESYGLSMHAPIAISLMYVKSTACRDAVRASTCERQCSPARRRSCIRSCMEARSCCGELAALACRRSDLLPCEMVGGWVVPHLLTNGDCEAMRRITCDTIQQQVAQAATCTVSGHNMLKCLGIQNLWPICSTLSCAGRLRESALERRSTDAARSSWLAVGLRLPPLAMPPL
jgi:hypothetical protein